MQIGVHIICFCFFLCTKSTYSWLFQWKQEISSELSDSPLRLQYFIIITGAAYFISALVIPTFLVTTTVGLSEKIGPNGGRMPDSVSWGGNDAGGWG